MEPSVSFSLSDLFRPARPGVLAITLIDANNQPKEPQVPNQPRGWPSAKRTHALNATVKTVSIRFRRGTGWPHPRRPLS